MLVVGAVAEIEAGHIHPCIDQLKDFLIGGNSRADGADNFGAREHIFHLT